MAINSLILVVFALLARQAYADCVFHSRILGDQGVQCYEFDFSTISTDPTVYTLHDSYPDTYLVSAPCRTVPLPQQQCKNTSCPVLIPSSMYQLYSQNNGCIACGGADYSGIAPLDPLHPENGVKILYQGGNACPGSESPREMAYLMVCNASAPENIGPEPLVNQGSTDGYTVTWQSPHACGKLVSPSLCPAPALPLPTQPQLDWQRLEIGVIIHYNIATSAGSQGCGDLSSPPKKEIFQPTADNFTVGCCCETVAG